jgi:hypothetical protein
MSRWQASWGQLQRDQGQQAFLIGLVCGERRRDESANLRTLPDEAWGDGDAVKENSDGSDQNGRGDQAHGIDERFVLAKTGTGWIRLTGQPTHAARQGPHFGGRALSRGPHWQRALIFGQVDRLIGSDGLVQEFNGGTQGLGEPAAVVAGAQVILDGFIAFLARGKRPSGQDFEDLVTV